MGATAAERREETDTDTRSLLVRVPSDLHDALKRRSTAEDRSMASTIRQALRLYLAEEGAA